MSPFAEREMAREIMQPTWTDAVVAAGIFAVLTFVAGYELAKWREAQKPPQPARIEYRQAPAPLTQWKCTGHERAEYFEACKQRKFSDLTKPKASM